MEKEQIIKALEWCSELRLCVDCPMRAEGYFTHSGNACRQALMKNTLTLIKEQGERIFKLENRLKECENGYSQTLAIERMKIIDLLATVERLSNVCKLNDKVGEDYIRVSKENRDLKEMLIKEHYDTEERTVRRIQEALRERIKGVYLDEGEICAIIDEVAEGILESEGKSGG